MGLVARLINLPALEVDFIISHLANNPSKGNIDDGLEEIFWFSIVCLLCKQLLLLNIISGL